MRMTLLALLAAARLLPTGATLDPVAPAHPVGNFPLAAAVAPDGKHVALLLCGWRQQGVQIVDRTTGAVTQTLSQRAAFIGLAFSPDGKTLYASGGNEDAIYVYRWSDGTATPDGTIVLAQKPDPKKSGTSYPAGLALSPDGSRLYVAENLGDTLAVVDVAQRKVIARRKTGRYPYGVVADAHGNVYVSCWAEDGVDVFSGERLEQRKRISVGRHPSAMVLHGRDLYVTSATTDSIAVVTSGRLARVLTDAAPSGPREGSTPNALAVSNDGKRLFVAEAGNDAVAVFDTKTARLLGRVPVEWYPSALAIAGDDVLVVNAKGGGSAPNPERAQPDGKWVSGNRDYTLGQLDGSLLSFRAAAADGDLRAWSKRVASANRWDAARERKPYPPFRHVIYVIKENRTYDQVLGDMPEGDGDKSLLFFGNESAPNHHALAARFGLFDRFFTNAEVSADGHNWSTAAYATDYLEKTVPSEYSGRGRTYDYEGTNRGKLVDDDEDAASPSTGYLWDLANRKGISLRNYGEFVYGRDEIFPGPRQAMKSGLRKTSDLEYPGFDLNVKDQTRIDIWLREFRSFERRGKLPVLEIVRLPNDHTSGTEAGKPTPRAYMADNDLALGRLVEAVSRSKFWRDTVIFVLEDDAQSGPDHVDSHRSLLLTISAWNQPGTVHRFVNTTDVIATIEQILGLGSMSEFDHFGRPLSGLFASKADLRPYTAIKPAVDLDEKNPPAPAAVSHQSALDFSRADAIDDDTFNRILWKAIKGDAPYPGPRRAAVGEMTR